jgi:hypothetical protein
VEDKVGLVRKEREKGGKGGGRQVRKKKDKWRK